MGKGAQIELVGRFFRLFSEAGFEMSAVDRVCIPREDAERSGEFLVNFGINICTYELRHCD